MDISTFWPRTGLGWRGAGGREAFWLFRHTQMKKNSRAMASGIATLGTRMYRIPILLLPCFGKSEDNQNTQKWSKYDHSWVILNFNQILCKNILTFGSHYEIICHKTDVKIVAHITHYNITWNRSAKSSASHCYCWPESKRVVCGTVHVNSCTVHC